MQKHQVKRNFHGFNPQTSDWTFDENEMAEILPKYQRINDFLKQNLTNLKMIRCSFWNCDCIYVLGQTNSDDFAGVFIRSDFNYNP
jgi:Nuclease A inhibitor-like protein